MVEAVTEIMMAPMPPSLAAPEPPPAAPVEPSTEPATDALGVPPKEKKPAPKLSEATLAALLGAAYADLYEVAGRLYVGEQVAYAPQKMELRGKQWAIAFKELGWDDAKIVLMVGLVVGLGSDFAGLHQFKQQKAEEKKMAKSPGAKL